MHSIKALTNAFFTLKLYWLPANCNGQCQCVRAKHIRSAYARRKLIKRQSTAYANPKSWNPPKREKKQDSIVKLHSSSETDGRQLHPDAIKQLKVIMTEYKYALYNIIQSGNYDNQVTGMKILKIGTSPGGSELVVLWEPTGDLQQDTSLEAKLLTYTPAIQKDFDEHYPNIKVPTIRFENAKSETTAVSRLIANLELGDDKELQNSDNVSMRTPSISLVQDVYELDRAAMLSRIANTSNQFTQFGAYDQSPSSDITGTSENSIGIE